MKRALFTILLAPNTLFRDGLESVLAATAYRVQFMASDVSELRCPLAKGRRTLFIVASDGDADELSRNVAALRKEHENATVVVIAATGEAVDCRKILRAGAAAYLLKGITAEVLVKSLDLATAGGIVISTGAVLDLTDIEEASARPQVPIHHGRPPMQPAVASDVVRCLSQRESEILGYLVQGESNKHIGRYFDITEATVKVHVKAILRKISAKNRTQAAIWAMTHLGSGIKAKANGAAIGKSSSDVCESFAH